MVAQGGWSKKFPRLSDRGRSPDRRRHGASLRIRARQNLLDAGQGHKHGASAGTVPSRTKQIAEISQLACGQVASSAVVCAAIMLADENSFSSGLKSRK